MPTLAWYLRRARAMSPGEALHRLQLASRKLIWRMQVSRGANGHDSRANWSLYSREPLDLNLPQDTDETRDLLAEADSYLRHEWHFHNLSGLREHPIDWHADPMSGKVAPRQFGFDINHRDEALLGNVKVIWEKSRHHHLTLLAIAYALTKDDRYSAEVADQILDWIQQDPYLIGVNWTHPLEQGIRLIAWVWCDRFLRGSVNHERVFGKDSPVWTSIHNHQEFIEITHSRGSSANNHLIGEMAGLFIASTAWPVFGRSQHWQDYSRGILEQEIVNQTFPSGINRELAFSYHVFALEFFVLSLLEAERSGVHFSNQYRAYATRMLEVLPQLTDWGGNLPRYGDGDEGMAIQLQVIDERRDAWLYRMGRSLLNAHVPVPKEGALAAKLLGLDPPVSELAPSMGSVAFEDAGIYVLTSRRGTPDEVFVLADAGPHGYLSIAAHAHADALSFTLSVGGKPILVDPGTYVYHTDGHWRSFFRGTRAHNTVVVDNLDQSTQGGPFLWNSKAKTAVDAWLCTNRGASLVASHDGYAATGVIHRRRLELRDKLLTISDTLQGKGTHQVALCFHLAPECRVEPVSSSVFIVSRHDHRVCLTLPQELGVELIRGGKEAGWYSPRFAVKQETCSIIAHGKASLPISFETQLEVGI